MAGAVCRVLGVAIAALLLGLPPGAGAVGRVERPRHFLRSPEGAAEALPVLRYRFSSFATPVPEEAGKFLVKYFGGQILSKGEYLTHHDSSPEAVVVGVRFPYEGGARFTDIYFVNDPTKPQGDGLTVREYAGHLHKTHRFDLQETWDWYQDWHYCFWTEDLDLVLYRLLLDDVPVVTRSSYSFYVEIPGGITFQFLGRKMDVIWSETFNFCRQTNGEAQVQPMQIGTIPDELPPLPELAPSHHSFFSNQPGAVAEFLRTFTSGDSVDLRPLWKESHRYSDGRCAMLEWIQFEGFQVHMVQQFRKWEGKGLTTREVEDYLTSLHGDMNEKDAFMDYRVGFEVDTLEPFKDKLDAHGVHYLMEGSGRSILVQLPGGIIFELLLASGQSTISR